MNSDVINEDFSQGNALTKPQTQRDIKLGQDEDDKTAMSNETGESYICNISTSICLNE